ncbi:unnamed protein product [Paramecium sonneborni]|uniref:Uncharacterized protein n=1 Tax=Paramecium sonneborni TaxID=65129 RepID=A0A8S1R6R7_9CILI|nr:unnamed protein product [Paramecium sonneborni]
MQMSLICQVDLVIVQNVLYQQIDHLKCHFIISHTLIQSSIFSLNENYDCDYQQDNYNKNSNKDINSRGFSMMSCLSCSIC